MTSDLEWDDPLRPSGDQASSWQGITHVTLDLEHATLTVNLLQSAAFYDVVISGPKPIGVVSVTPYDSALGVVLAETGGRGTYFVTLVALPEASIPIHPFFATASFTFTIDCETGDCTTRAPSNPLIRPAETAPAVDLLTKDFDGFLQLLGDRVRVQNPDWQDFAPASFERVLLELFAHHADLLSYYQDRVASEAFLDTASQRFSVRQHGILLGYDLFDGEAATTLLSFDVNEPVVAPAKLAIAADRRTDEAPVVFSVTTDTLLDPALDTTHLVPAQWPEAFTARVPAGATSMLLMGTVTALEPGQRVAFVQEGAATQVRTITAVEQPLSLPGWVDDPRDDLSSDPVAVTRIHWDEGLAFDLAVWMQPPPDSSEDPHVPLEIHANLVDARHGQWKRAQLLDVPTELDDREPHLALTPQSAIVAPAPVDDSDALPQLRALRLPEGPVLFDRTGEELAPAIELTIDDQVWFRQPHLQRSQPFDRHYVASADNDGRVWLLFGDGRRGRPIELVKGSSLDLGTAKLKPGSELHVQYRVGPPLAGNVDAGKLVVVVPGQEFDDLERITSVTNVTPGIGGQQPETLDAARLAIPASLRSDTLQRAVTIEDYARLVELADARVARAVARDLGEPFNTVLVLVDPKDEAVLDEDLRTTLELALDKSRMVGREVLIQAAENVPLDVEIVICVSTGFAKHAVKLAVLDALRPGDPARPGFFHPNRLSFGQDVELGDLIAETQRVPGVLAVKVIKFRRLFSMPPDVLPRIELATIEIARLDADDLNPENGRLVVRVAGLDPLPAHVLEFAQSEAARQGGSA